MKKLGWVVFLMPVVLAGCPKRESDTLTLAQAAQALEETQISDEAASLTSSSVEIATTFTIGQAVRNAAAEVRDFIGSQLPCAEITLADATLTVEYGARPGNCTYKGHEFGGTHSITIEKNDMGDVVVGHVWTDMNNGIVSVTGEATVTWSFANESRRVQHRLEWTRIRDGRTATGSGDRTQTLLEGGLLEGIQIDGSRSWEGSSGQWDLAIDGVQMRWVDPVPQDGTYTLSTPFDKTLSLGFDRVNEETIKVTISSGRRSFDFDVKRLR